MKVLVTADDYGLTRGVTDTILEAVDNGSINCVSIIANGEDFERAAQLARERPALQIALHLNLTDGKPCADISAGRFLGPDGSFCNVFQSLWFRYLVSAHKQQWQGEVEMEIRAQVARVRAAFPGRELLVNGHDHIHLIPFVFDALAQVADELGVSYIRLAQEPFFFYARGWRQYVGGGMVKHLLLKILSWRARRRMRGVRANVPNVFVGVLFTGAMSVSVVQHACANFLSRREDVSTIEILFHPGAATPDEAQRWPAGGRTARWFTSNARRLERDEACDPLLKKYIPQLQNS